jgi:hypothetical protein
MDPRLKFVQHRAAETYHAQEPSTSKESTKILDGNDHERAESKADHHERERPTGSKSFAGHADKRPGQDVWDEEDGKDQVVVVSFQAEILLETCRLCVA